MMQRLLAGLLAVLGLACAGVVAAQQVYKWVDNKGVTHYGEAAPTGRPSQAVDATPSGSVRGPSDAQECYTIRCQYDRLRSERLQDEAQQLAIQQTAAAQRATNPRARGMSFETYRKLSGTCQRAKCCSGQGRPITSRTNFSPQGISARPGTTSPPTLIRSPL